MKRFLYQLAAFGMLLTLLFFLVCFVIPFKVVGEREYNMGILDKITRLQATEHADRRRLILVGGSNLAFGIDSEKIEEQTGMLVINMGIAAGQGLGYILHTLEPYIQDGDTIVLAAEYGFFAGGWNGSHERLIYMLDIHGESIFTLIRPGFLGWPSGIDNYVRWKFYRVVTHPHTWKSLGPRSWWNRYGDVTGHFGLPSIPFEVHKGNTRVDRIDTFAVAAMSNYLHRVRQDHPDTTFLLSFPAIEQQSFQFYAPIIPVLTDQLIGIGLEMISRPDDYVFPYEDFWNSMWHLRQEPRQIRTDRLIRDYLIWQGGG